MEKKEWYILLLVLLMLCVTFLFVGCAGARMDSRDMELRQLRAKQVRIEIWVRQLEHGKISVDDLEYLMGMEKCGCD